jgi:2-C-methyl-D-erythritol 4-phosphate cytidylyltransferase
MSVWGIVTAAGSGTRFGARKQYLDLGGVTLLERAIRAVAADCDGVVVTLPPDDAEARHLVAGVAGSSVVVVAGGATRQDSVRNALAAVPLDAEVIVVHGPSHPLASRRLVAELVAQVRSGADAVVPVRPVLDALKRLDADGRIAATVDKSGVATAQCPQAFSATAFRAAHASGHAVAEDSELIELLGGRLVTFLGPASNLHVAAPEDLELLRAVVAGGLTEVAESEA